MKKFKTIVCVVCAAICSAVLFIPTTKANEDCTLKIEKSQFPGYAMITVSKNSAEILNCFSNTDYINKLAQAKFKRIVPYNVFYELNSIEPITTDDLEYIQYLNEETDVHRGTRGLTDEENEYLTDIDGRNLSIERIISKLDCSLTY